jgi:hypothetical protein
MHRIPQSALSNWQPFCKEGPVAPRSIDIACAKCSRHLTQATLTWYEAGNNFAYSSFKCAGCGAISHFLILTHRKIPIAEQREKSQVFVMPAPPIRTLLPEGVAEIAPKFASIYEQALRAEHLGLLDLVGMGYRKALEFLIKEWLVAGGTEEAIVAKKLLSHCIREHITDPRIQSSAERAAWLGNDETHYFRQWTDFDLRHLKELFEIVLHWIGNDLAIRRYEDRMKRQ